MRVIQKAIQLPINPGDVVQALGYKQAFDAIARRQAHHIFKEADLAQQWKLIKREQERVFLWPPVAVSLEMRGKRARCQMEEHPYQWLKCFQIRWRDLHKKANRCPRAHQITQSKVAG